MLSYQPLGDSGLRIEFSKEINRATIIKIRSFLDILEAQGHKFIIESVPGYNTLTVFYRPLLISYEGLVCICKELERQHFSTFTNLTETIDILNVKDLSNAKDTFKVSDRVIEIPVLYGGEHGPDLEDVAYTNGLTAEQVIEIHAEPVYLVYIIGFTPGFPYLGEMSEKIATPRLAEPRLNVKAGSVGIANQQTGIYSVDSPGGWRIIGHTPLKIFNPASDTPFLLNAGDMLIFKSIDRDEYEEIHGRVEHEQHRH
ncbi:5-oxoprolinase subunit PxpB [Desulfuribacillus alkaliarsenatis]|uniref:Carboxyltransferase domain-containing protein n=1 Tax=Desulfuribacillus alkaliarsenatis TaxID=766136 RepID=A0A1E5FYV8_9FIRM|nr:5-oxoprolinase subunit PxpB [Desulfuribacillus alkaliarsenatis]OEF95627.1 hypothetical protein BHF68_12345 [Desulfuribacillus alkaliarsenatis]